jgi:hypothetical protein
MVVQLLDASREEAAVSRTIADQSQKITLEMQKDSVAMKTVTFFFAFMLSNSDQLCSDRSLDHVLPSWHFLCCEFYISYVTIECSILKYHWRLR